MTRDQGLLIPKFWNRGFSLFPNQRQETMLLGIRHYTRPVFRTTPLCKLVLGRSLATHRDPPSFLSEQLDHRTSSKKSPTSVGPFPLGVYPGTTTTTTQPKKWSELSTGGKFVRGTARTSNLTVILFGGALSCVLAYALATELFARNSPTVLYADACTRIESSTEVCLSTVSIVSSISRILNPQVLDCQASPIPLGVSYKCTFTFGS